MNEQVGSTPSLELRALQSTAAHLAERYAGVLSPDLVERVVFESYTSLARTARVRTHLSSLAGHFAADRLAALAHAQAGEGPGVPQVLFLDEHDIGRSQVAAALLTHCARGAVTARSAGYTPTAAVDPVVEEVLAERGITVQELYPKPVTDDVLRAADWVITFTPHEDMGLYPGTMHQRWDVEPLAGASPDQARRIMAAVDQHVRALWETVQARTGTAPGVHRPST